MAAARVARRGMLAGAGAALAAACSGRACSRAGTSAGEAGSSSPLAPVAGWHDVVFAASDDQPAGQRALVFAPPGSSDWPVVVALHGRGEAGRGLALGAGAWRDSYELDAALERLSAGAVTAQDARGMLPAARLREVNASLAKTPYRGLVVACPYTPLSAERGAGSAEPFARFVVSVLLPKVAELKGGGVMRDGTGIDGISMGGRYALLVGFAHPDVFGAVGAMQPAIAAGEVDSIADLARSAGARRPQRVRLVSSQGDPFLGVTRALADALEVRGVAHRLVVTDGPHDYAWNRGPGGIELAVFHERALRGLDPP